MASKLTIPKGWKKGTIGELANGIRGVTFASEDVLGASDDSSVILLRSNNIKDGRINFEEVYHLPPSFVSDDQLARLGDVAVCMSNGSKRLVGKAARVSKNNADHRIAVGAFCALFRPTSDADPDFVPYLFDTESYRRELHITLSGSTINNLKNSDIEGIKIPLPPLAEQRKIAEILRTWDEAIEAAEAELKALQERKRWLMDRFLRPCLNHGQGDGAVGELVKIGEVLKVRHGKNQRAVETAGGAYPILGTGGEIGRSNSFIYNKPSVLIGRKGTIDRPQFMDTPFWTIDTLFYTEIGPRVVPLFMYYVFCSINWQQYNAATGVPSLASSAIESIKLHLPALEIQAEVAKALKHCDDLADSCASKANLLRTQKRGLMQKLLTGEVRVAA